MGFSCGITGLPNVGKSTLFNALTRTAAAQMANYPFCTIDPNIGEVDVPDARLHKLADLAHSAKRVPARMRFVDIAGLVKGAASGEGLGNRFLANIRSVDAIVHVLRCFENPEITHVEGRIDPLGDLEIIETELMLADMESLEKRLPALKKKAVAEDKTLILCQTALRELESGRPARMASIREEDKGLWRSLDLLTSKPVLHVANVEEAAIISGNELSSLLPEPVIISAAIESELAELSGEERREYMQAAGIEISGLDRLVQAGYSLLGLHTFFTAGPKEARAWTIPKNTLAPQAAARIHGDFERGFICAETASYPDFIDYGGEQGARSAGKLRQEGRAYVVQDGDVIHFRFNV